jgi:hypothetical protein
MLAPVGKKKHAIHSKQSSPVRSIAGPASATQHGMLLKAGRTGSKRKTNEMVKAILSRK